MKDIAIDDQIKKDKQKQKNKQRAQTRGDRRGPKRINRNPGPPRQRPKPRQFNRSSDTRQPNKYRPTTKTYPKKPYKKFNSRLPDQKPQQKKQKGRTLKVLGLHPDITNQQLYKLFATEGALQKCMIQQDNFGRNLPTAIVKYYTVETAQKAIKTYNDQKVLNSVLKVEYYRNVRK